MTFPWKTALVVGASSGIGKAIAEELLRSNVSVAMVARRLEPMEEIERNAPEGVEAFAYAHDVKNYDATPELFQEIAEDLGGLDLIVYASGVMPDVDEHEFNFTKDREILEVNSVAAFAWLDEAAKRFERTKQGTIVGISSIAGDRGRRGSPAYCTSKAALTTYLESLRNRLSRSGVHVVTVKPGPIDTPMTKGKANLPGMVSAERAAHEILIAAKKNKHNAYIPFRWAIVAFVIKRIPSFIFRHLPI
jgi:short-subunit dehydrogenase